MQVYDAFEAPLQLYGVHPENIKCRNFQKLPASLIEKMPQYEELGRRNTGVRLRFRTDAPKFTLRMVLETEEVDPQMALPGSAGLDVYEGIGSFSRFLGIMAPWTYGFRNRPIEKEFAKSPGFQTITLNLPRNERLLSLELLLPDGASVSEAPAYRCPEPIVFYGSSITEGGCAPRPGTAYTSILCRWLDCDYLNYGFSGGAKGEPLFAEYIASIEPMSLFVMDYDHNAPDAEHLARTHEPFFRIIREARPELPIVIMSRPDFDSNPEDSRRRRDIIMKTYLSARAAGDPNVYFVNGENFFGDMRRDECTIDGCHPNALGFGRMAEYLYPQFASLLY